jgi:hypothetical protein
MNRGWEKVFHAAVHSSFESVVNRLWKLCKAGRESEMRLSYAAASEEFGTDF